MNSLLLVVLLLPVIAVNALPADKFPNGLGAKEYDHGVHESSDERLQWKELNLVDSDEDYTKEPEPLDRLGSQMLNFEDEKIQNEIELRNGPNTTTAEPSGDCESNGGECKKNKKQCKATISTEFTCSSKGVCCIEEAKAQGASELMLEMLSNTILIQAMAMQTLKEDQENSMSNLTDIIVNLKQTVEIKNSNLSDAISNQGVALQIMKSNLSDAISNEGMAIQNTIMSNLTDGFSDQEDMLVNIEDNQDVIMSNLTHHLGCPEGFMVAPVTGQCFKLYKDAYRTWTAAKSKCESNGLSMAETDYPVSLRRAIMQTYGLTSGYYSWVGAKGDGSYMRWQSNSAIISSSNYWYYYSASSSYCLSIMTNSYLTSSTYMNRPYYPMSCTNTAYTLCEYV